MTTDELTYQPGLDGLRAFAVAGVLLFHGGVSWATGGFLGVSTFFTLSGFLITSLVLHRHASSGRVNLREFWSRRARRLLPAAGAALLLAIAYTAFAGEAYQFHRLNGDVVAALLYVENWRYVFTHQSYIALFSSPSPVEHFWSLAIEEQFYLVFPIMAAGLLFLGRGSRRWFSIGVATVSATSLALMLLLYRAGADPSRVYYGTDTRAFEIGIGALLALTLTRRRRNTLARSTRTVVVVQALGLAALVGIALVWASTSYVDGWLYRGGMAAYALMSAALILAATTPGPVRWLLSRAPLRSLGRISYGVYLYHWPIFLWIDKNRSGLAGPALLAVRVAVTVALAALSFRFVEAPMRSRHALTGRWPWLLAPAGVATVCVALVLVTANPPAPKVVFSAARAGSDSPPTSPAPRTGTGVSRILVVGDSVAQTLGRGIERWGGKRGVAVWNRGQFYCGVVRGGQMLVVVPLNGCDPLPRWKDDLGKFHADVVVVMSTTWDIVPRRWNTSGPWLEPGNPVYDSHYIADNLRTIDLLSSTGARVVILAPPCVTNHHSDQLYALERRLLFSTVLRERVKQASVVDLTPKLCPGGAAVNDIDGVHDVRPDGLHFSDAGADWVVGWLMPEIERAAKGG